MPSRGRRATCTALRAGKQPSQKKVAYTPFIAAKSFISFKNVVERAARGGKHGAHVFKRAAGLRLDAGFKFAGRGIDAELTGSEDEIPRAHGLRIGADGGGRFFGGNELFHESKSLLELWFRISI